MVLINRHWQEVLRGSTLGQNELPVGSLLSPHLQYLHSLLLFLHERGDGIVEVLELLGLCVARAGQELRRRHTFVIIGVLPEVLGPVVALLLLVLA